MVAVIFDNEPYTPVLLEDTNTLRKVVRTSYTYQKANGKLHIYTVSSDGMI